MVTLRFKSLPTYIPPQTSFKSLKLGFLSPHENDVLEVFGLSEYKAAEIVVHLMRQPDMRPGQRLHFLEGLFESHFPWLLEFMEIFWDYCKFHKFVYNNKHECKNIFDYHDCKYYYPYQRKACFICEREKIIIEIKESKERYRLLNNIF